MFKTGGFDDHQSAQVSSFLEISMVFSAVLMVLTLNACDRQDQ